MQIRTSIAVLACCALFAGASARAQQADIRIALVYDKTGPMEAYAKQTRTGFMMGLDYATGGSMTVAGRKITVIERDCHGKPDVGRAQLAAAYADDRVDLAVGAASSGVTMAMLPIAEEYKKILLIEPAVADAITGAKWHRYIFRTARNSSQDAISNAVAQDMPGTVIATLGQDTVFGHDGVSAFKAALKNARIVHEEFLPPSTTDFTASAQRLIDKLRDAPGRKVIWIIWAGGGNPFKIGDLDLQRHGIEIASGGNILPAMAVYKNFPGMQGATYYYYDIPKNPVNDALVARHFKAFNKPPDFFTAGGFSAAMAVATALNKTAGKADSESLIKAMEGMSFETPKGRMTFRREDHQAMQSMYHFRIRNDPAAAWGVPELVHEITAEEMNIPIRNGLSP